jgi:phytanoyl-CoA hydroxylase
MRESKRLYHGTERRYKMTKIKSCMDSYEVSKEQLDFYDDNGYLLIKSLWSKEDMDLMRKDMDDLADGHFTNKLDQHHHRSLGRAHRGKKMCDIGDALLRERAVPIGSISFFCKPNNPLELGSLWHQDNYGGKTTDGKNYLNLAIAIDDADKTNGALKVIPGSHKLGMLPCNPKPNFARDEEGRLYQCAPIGNDCELPEDLPIVQLEYNSGDILAVNGLLIHTADRNDHPTRWRRTIYFVYIKNGEPFWPGWTARRELLERYDSPDYIEDEDQHER